MDASLKTALTTLELPADAELPDVLALRYQYTREQIAAAGLAGRVSEAELQKAALIVRAASALAPLGIGLPALDQFVIELLKRRAESDETTAAARQPLKTTGVAARSAASGQ